LNVNQFISMYDTQERIKAWRIDSNGYRPHSSLDKLTLSKFAAKAQEQRTSEVAIF
jgi:putative transposase